MNLNLLECFLCLAENLSFTQTAKQLGLTQPSVSRQIKALEEDLKTQLFVRDKHQVRLTEEGKRLRARLSPLLEEMEQTLQSAKGDTETIEGALRFACYPEAGRSFFMEHLIEFQKRNPQIELKITYLLDDQMTQSLKSGKLDLAVTGVPLLSETFRSYSLVTERSVLVTKASNSQAPQDLENPLFIAYHETDQLLQEYLKRFFRNKDVKKIKRIFTVNSHESMIDLLLSHPESYAVLPYFSVRNQIHTKKLRIVSDREIKNKLYLVHLESAYQNQKITAFKKFLLARCKEAALE